MIATVRIAPVDRWCEPMKQIAASLTQPPAIGATIKIDTESLQKGKPKVFCDGRCWLVVDVPSQYAAIDAETGELCASYGLGPNWVCEHVLELGD